LNKHFISLYFVNSFKILLRFIMNKKLIAYTISPIKVDPYLKETSLGPAHASYLNPKTGIHYVIEKKGDRLAVPIKEIHEKCSFIEAAFIIMTQKDPKDLSSVDGMDSSERFKFKNTQNPIAFEERLLHRAMDADSIDLLNKVEIVLTAGCPTTAHPMDMLDVALTTIKSHLGKNDSENDDLQVLSLLPDIILRIINHRESKNLKMPEKASYLGKLGTALGIDEEQTSQLGKWLLLHFAHGNGNASSIASIVARAAGQTCVGSLKGGLLAFNAERHGLANEDILNMIDDYLKPIEGSPENPDVSLPPSNYLPEEPACIDYMEKLNKRMPRILPGLGHGFLNGKNDPRSVILQKDMKDTLQSLHTEKAALAGGSKEFKVVDQQIKRIQFLSFYMHVGTNRLASKASVRFPNPNVDCLSGSVLLPLLKGPVLENPDSAYAPLFFFFARSFGMMSETRAYKGALIRPAEAPVLAPPNTIKL
jgi:citrate synthase